MPEITSRKKRYRVIANPNPTAMAIPPLDFHDLERQIGQLAVQMATLDEGGNAEPAAKVVDKLGNKMTGTRGLVVEMTDDTKAALEADKGEAIEVLEDFSVDMQSPVQLNAMGVEPLNFFPVSTDEALKFRIRILSADGKPVAKASVRLSGSFWSDDGVTNTQGRVTLTMFEETVDSPASLIVRPATGFWGRVVSNPALSDSEENILSLEGLGAITGQPDFPTVQIKDWALSDMGLNLPAVVLGPVKVAVIDSGIDASHPDLAPTGGRDFGPSDDPDATFVNDGSGHGTHVSGTIAALDNAFGVVGAAAAGVEIFGNRVFPEAKMSKLELAIDWCVDNDIDIINMSLGSAQNDSGFKAAVEMARQAGILCIAAAGNSASPVMFPAAYPTVMAVAALGKVGSFPETSPHQARISEHVVGNYFAASFTCFGPEINVTAPGVGVISTVPGGGYAPWDGPSMAGPHVPGLAARLLQTRADIRAVPRGPARVDALFAAVEDSCSDLGLPPQFQGRGMPSFVTVPTPPQPPQPVEKPVAKKDSSAIALINQALEVLES